MRNAYDPGADALYIESRRATPHDSVDLEQGVTADLDADGRVTGLEVLDARAQLGNDALASIAIERLPLTLQEIA